MELPLHLAWSGLRHFDVSDEKLLVSLYRIVLTSGLRDDLTGYLNAKLLVRHWPRLRIAVGKPVRTCWERRFPELVATEATSTCVASEKPAPAAPSPPPCTPALRPAPTPSTCPAGNSA